MTSQRRNSTVARRRMRIGGRLLVLLAVPLVGLLAVTGFGVFSGIRQSQTASTVRTDTDVALNSYALATELQHQRSTLISGEDLSEASAAEVASRTAAIKSGLSTLDPSAQRRAATTLAHVQGSLGVGRHGLGGNAALAAYSSAIDSVLDLATDSIDTSGSIDSAAASTADNLARAQASSAEEYDRLLILAGEDQLTAESFQKLVGLAAAQRSYARLAATTAPEALAVQIQRVVHGVNAADEIREQAFGKPEVADLSAWTAGVGSRTEELTGLQGEASQLAVQVVNDFSRSARNLLMLAAGAAVATLLTTIVLLRRAVQSIARPLEELASQAEDVARVRLPEAVKAQQDDPDAKRELPELRGRGAAEVFEVAAAFNDIQDTALRLASEQATLRVNQSQALTNLGRRNQTLLARQLDYITGLETEETDPEFLEHLFKLDHLASRMRRNAESILILAGSETPRRRRTPAEVSEVIRASMSEVEDFERVRIGHLYDSTLAGPVVIDLVHLLAELIENALGFSPPDSTVEIDGGPLGQGGYQFAIIDHGVGMSDVELMAANHRLAGLDEFDGMPTRYLGQYVVAKLAAKMSVMVRLQPSAGGRGVTAMVTIPATALIGALDRSGSSRPRPGTRASREQGPAPFAPGSAVINSDNDRPAEPEAPVVVPDLRDHHVDSFGTLGNFGVAESPDDAGSTEEFVVEAPQFETAEESLEALLDDVDADRWDSVVESVLEAVESGNETSSPEEVSASEAADVFGVAPQDGMPKQKAVADWWTTPPAKAPTDPSVDASTQNRPIDAEPAPDPVRRITPPDFNPAPGNPISQQWTGPEKHPSTADLRPASDSGALRKRVPGASLANREPGPADGESKPVERSAEAVRSRLASFQAGRSRGLRSPADDQADTQTAEPDTNPGDAEPSQDRRSI